MSRGSLGCNSWVSETEHHNRRCANASWNYNGNLGQHSKVREIQTWMKLAPFPPGTCFIWKQFNLIFRNWYCYFQREGRFWCGIKDYRPVFWCKPSNQYHTISVKFLWSRSLKGPFGHVWATSFSSDFVWLHCKKLCVCDPELKDLLEQFQPVSRRNWVRLKQSPNSYPPGRFLFIFTSIVYWIFRFWMVFATSTY